MLFKLEAGKRACNVRLSYIGRHNVTNALGAAALTLGAGVPLAAVRRGLAKARPFAMRMQCEDWRGVGIINDAYNANPASMQAALQTLAELPCRGRRIAVLGDMFELGKHTAREHRALGRNAAHSDVNFLFLLGERAELVQSGALAGGMSAAQIIIGKDHGDLGERLRALAKKGDWLLFKGSRGMRMEKVLTALKGGKV
jgi:UDP-N-acetylmuramoyl-tripeptide--D-alanyl-D-alanine ligase